MTTYYKKGCASTVTKEVDELISIREAAKVLGVHPSTLRNWDRAGRLKALRVGSRRDRRFKKSEVLAEAQAQRHDELVTAKDPKQAARMVPQDSIWRASIAEMAKTLGTTPAGLEELVARQGSIREAYVAEMAKTLGTTPAGLTDILARCEAAMDAFNPMHGFENLFKESFKYPFGQLYAQVLDSIPNFGGLLEPILIEQNLLRERMREYIGGLFDAETFSSGIYARLAATQAELFSTEAIATLAGSFKAADIVGTSSLVWDQITANIGAYQDLTRAALWDLDAMGLAGDKRLPFAEMKLAGGLLQSATTLVADLPAGAGDARGATVRKPNCFRYLHRQAQELEATEELSDLELEAQVRDLRSFQASNTGLQLVELWRHIDRVTQLNGQEPIFRPSVEAVAIAARLPLSFAGDEAELGELVDGLFKLIFEASAKGHRLQAVADPREYETVKDIVILRQYYRHDQAQEKSARACERNFGRLGDMFQRLVGKRYPSSPADWQRACLALMRQTLAFLRGVADKLEDLK